jgi:hypothetical protein
MLTNDDKEITVTDLYPELTPEEQVAAQENWLRYLRVVRRIFVYVSEENPEILTELEKRVRLRKEKEQRH